MSAVSFPGLCSLVRVSTKYDVASLREQAIRRLEERFPSNLNAFTGVDTVLSILPEEPDECHQIIRAIQMGHQLDIPQILPVAYYKATTYSLEEILSFRVDTTAFNPIQTIILAREKLLKKQIKNMVEGYSHGDGCGGQGCADAYKLQAYAQIHQENYGLAFRVNALAVGFLGAPSGRVCDQCADGAEDKVYDARDQLWRALPSYFGLPSWDEMKQ